MRATILILPLLLLALAAFAQTTPAKLYGYVQTVSAGMVQRGSIDETTGQETQAKPRRNQNYFIYLAGPKGVRIYPTEIWISGKQYSAQYTSVTETPVEIANNNVPGRPKSVTLVPKTTGSLLSLTPAPAAGIKGLASAKTKAKANDLVVVYKMKGKTYTSVLKKLNRLEPVALQ